jgi:hypothetical protein
MNRNIEAAGTGFSSPLIDSGGLTAAVAVLRGNRAGGATVLHETAPEPRVHCHSARRIL